ncbi:hypothetical protein JT31_02565 [Cedecea neteri]|uniref:Uncharacterized protein n=1 Tax=Cedecea neteri TaxID=158822 RepID=A0A089PT68_9ENTR|nr:MotA/TolQ/ExbB proton channel family protein [Cedecea neteri]AIR03537.1 hypothetical protein JT31_02565 [Cedecea neteri]
MAAGVVSVPVILFYFVFAGAKKMKTFSFKRFDAFYACASVGVRYFIYFIKAFWSVILLVAGGVFLFLDDIVSSIKSTPHPALVYTIFAFLIMGIVLAGWTLIKLFFYDSFARKWRRSDSSQYATLVNGLSHAMPYKEAFGLLVSYVENPLNHHRNELQRQVEHAEKEIGERLSFPGFIAGALVGIGLVGTFIGLLGALEDLGKLFAALTGGGDNSDPTAMFSAMLVQLQAPMKSMGTAFVASLYGLLGSLILGAVVLSVGKTATTLLGRVHDTAFDTFDKLSMNYAALQVVNEKTQVSDSEMVQLVMIKDDLLSKFFNVTQQLSAVTEAMTATAKALNERNLIDKKFTTVLSSGSHWIDSWQQINEQLTSLRSEQQGQNTKLLLSNNDILKAINTSSEKMALFNTLLAEALDASEGKVFSVGNEVSMILDGLNACRYSFEGVSAKLRTIVSMSVDRD